MTTDHAQREALTKCDALPSGSNDGQEVIFDTAEKAFAIALEMSYNNVRTSANGHFMINI